MPKIYLLSLSILLSASFSVQANEPFIPNELIDTPGFMHDVQNAQADRLNHRISQEKFIKMMNEPNTIVLDARSQMRYEQMHIRGAKNLNFSDFTARSLRELIPNDQTRILIYCNNNVKGSPIAFQSKAPSAALNLSTYTSLYSYGYRNIYELGPVIDPSNAKLQFEGSLVKPRN